MQAFNETIAESIVIGDIIWFVPQYTASFYQQLSLFEHPVPGAAKVLNYSKRSHLTRSVNGKIIQTFDLRVEKTLDVTYMFL